MKTSRINKIIGNSLALLSLTTQMTISMERVLFDLGVKSLTKSASIDSSETAKLITHVTQGVKSSNIIVQKAALETTIDILKQKTIQDALSSTPYMASSFVDMAEKTQESIASGQLVLSEALKNETQEVIIQCLTNAQKKNTLTEENKAHAPKIFNLALTVSTQEETKKTIMKNAAEFISKSNYLLNEDKISLNDSSSFLELTKTVDKGIKSGKFRLTPEKQEGFYANSAKMGRKIFNEDTANPFQPLEIITESLKAISDNTLKKEILRESKSLADEIFQNIVEEAKSIENQEKVLKKLNFLTSYTQAANSRNIDVKSQTKTIIKVVSQLVETGGEEVSFELINSALDVLSKLNDIVSLEKEVKRELAKSRKAIEKKIKAEDSKETREVQFETTTTTTTTTTLNRNLGEAPDKRKARQENKRRETPVVTKKVAEGKGKADHSKTKKAIKAETNLSAVNNDGKGKDKADRLNLKTSSKDEADRFSVDRDAEENNKAERLVVNKDVEGKGKADHSKTKKAIKAETNLSAVNNDGKGKDNADRLNLKTSSKDEADRFSVNRDAEENNKAERLVVNKDVEGKGKADHSKTKKAIKAETNLSAVNNDGKGKDKADRLNLKTSSKDEADRFSVDRDAEENNKAERLVVNKDVEGKGKADHSKTKKAIKAETNLSAVNNDGKGKDNADRLNLKTSSKDEADRFSVNRDAEENNKAERLVVNKDVEGKGKADHSKTKKAIKAETNLSAVNNDGKGKDNADRLNLKTSSKDEADRFSVNRDAEENNKAERLVVNKDVEGKGKADHSKTKKAIKADTNLLAVKNDGKGKDKADRLNLKKYFKEEVVPLSAEKEAKRKDKFVSLKTKSPKREPAQDLPGLQQMPRTISLTSPLTPKLSLENSLQNDLEIFKEELERKFTQEEINELTPLLKERLEAIPSASFLRTEQISKLQQGINRAMCFKEIKKFLTNNVTKIKVLSMGYTKKAYLEGANRTIEKEKEVRDKQEEKEWKAKQTKDILHCIQVELQQDKRDEVESKIQNIVHRYLAKEIPNAMAGINSLRALSDLLKGARNPKNLFIKLETFEKELSNAKKREIESEKCTTKSISLEESRIEEMKSFLMAANADRSQVKEDYYAENTLKFNKPENQDAKAEFEIIKQSDYTGFVIVPVGSENLNDMQINMKVFSLNSNEPNINRTKRFSLVPEKSKSLYPTKSIEIHKFIVSKGAAEKFEELQTHKKGYEFWTFKINGKKWLFAIPPQNSLEPLINFCSIKSEKGGLPAEVYNYIDMAQHVMLHPEGGVPFTSQAVKLIRKESSP